MECPEIHGEVNKVKGSHNDIRCAKLNKRISINAKARKLSRRDQFFKTKSIPHEESTEVLRDELDAALRSTSSLRAELDTTVKARDWYQEQVKETRNHSSLLVRYGHHIKSCLNI